MLKITNFKLVALIMLIGMLSLNAASKRMVLIEEATNASCGPCASQNPDFKSWIYDNKDDVIPLIYHAAWPGSDVMYSANPDQNTERISDYYGVSGVPSVRVNGQMTAESNGYYAGAPGNTEELSNEISQYSGDMSPLTIDVTHSIDGNTGTIEVEIHSDDVINNKKLHVAAVEAYHYYDDAGSNGEKEFYYIMRKMLQEDAKGEAFSINAGQTKNYSYDYQLDSEWYPQVMYAVAFVQDDSNKEVMQAGSSPIIDVNDIQTVEAEPAKDMTYLQADNGSSESATLTIYNTTSTEFDANISIDAEASMIPDDWTATLTSQTVTLPANGSADIEINYNVGNSAAFAVASVVITPVNVEGYIAIPSNTAFGLLSSNVKNAMYYGYDNFAGLNITTIERHADYADNFAFIPHTTDALYAYSPDIFDFVWLSYGATNGFELSSDQTDKNFINSTFQLINGVLSNGGNVLITADLGLYGMENSIYTGQNAAPNQNAEELFYNKMGMQWRGLLNLIQDNQLYQMTVNGVDGTEFEGLELSVNAVYSNNFGVYQQYVDVINVNQGSNADKLMYLQDDETQFGVVGYETEDGGKIVYSSVRFGPIGENSSDQTQRDNFFAAIDEYFNAGDVEPDGPSIAADKDMIDFGSTDIPLTETLVISNTGDETLSISNVAIDGDEEFTVDFDGEPVNISAGETYELSVIYTPMVEGDNNAELIITSNAGNEAELLVELKGNSTTSVIDGLAGIEGKFTMSVGPNPMTDESSLTYFVNGNDKVRVKIDLIDASGSFVRNVIDEYKVSGEYNLQINSKELSSGTYYLISNTNSVKAQLPLVIVK